MRHEARDLHLGRRYRRSSDACRCGSRCSWHSKCRCRSPTLFSWCRSGPLVAGFLQRMIESISFCSGDLVVCACVAFNWVIPIELGWPRLLLVYLVLENSVSLARVSLTLRLLYNGAWVSFYGGRSCRIKKGEFWTALVSMGLF